MPVRYIGELDSTATSISILRTPSRLRLQLAMLSLEMDSPTILSYREENFPTLILNFLDSASIGRSFLLIAPSVQSWIKKGWPKPSYNH